MIDLLREDGPLLAVNKPPGLATQAPQEFPSLERATKDYLKEKHGKPGNVYLGIPHRLDRPVSGVVVFAKNSKAAARLAEQFQKRQTRKIYWALLETPLGATEGTLIDFVRKIPDEPRAEVVAEGESGARQAVLRYRTLGSLLTPGPSAPATLVEIELETGRMHQIRIQFASRGSPILGDVKYGARSHRVLNDPIIHAETGGEQIFLHARSLTLRHPIRYDELEIVAPLPTTWPPLPGDFST